ncbi:hypothetical protein LCGC14_3098100, partial [marine sediment metagenome]
SFLCGQQNWDEWWNEWWTAASTEQRQSVQNSYETNKPYDKGLTLGSFNPIESSGGMFLVRSEEKSGGLYAQRAYNAAKRENKRKRLNIPLSETWKYPFITNDNPTKLEIDVALQRLIMNRNFDDEHARAHLDELLKQYNGNWRKVWQAWNGQKEGQASQVRVGISFLARKFKYNR